MLEPNREELAWAAGFFDGEGHVRCRRSNTTKQLILQVNQVGRETLDRLRQTVGFGTVDGPYQNGTQVNRSPHYKYWVCNFEHVQAAIALMWPWLSSPKKSDARQALLDMRVYNRGRG